MKPGILGEVKAAINEILNSIRKPGQPKVKFQLSNMCFFFQFVRPVWKIGTLSIGLAVMLAGLQSLLPLSSKIFIDL
jgi:hypothetical protein